MKRAKNDPVIQEYLQLWMAPYPNITQLNVTGKKSLGLYHSISERTYRYGNEYELNSKNFKYLVRFVVQ